MPQGAIPGPLFFLLYVDVMTNYCNRITEIVRYADDTLIFVADENPSTASEAIETQTERLCSYFEKYKLQLNALKTEFVIFGKYPNPRNLKMSIKVGKETIHASKSWKYLGKIMDCGMSFQSQINSTLRIMATSVRTLPPNEKKLSLNNAKCTF